MSEHIPAPLLGSAGPDDRAAEDGDKREDKYVT